MKEIVLPSYNELELVLSKTKLQLHPSQVHGMVCGMLCGNSNIAPAWEELVTGGDKLSSDTHQVLQTLFEATAKQLNEFIFDLQLVLPDDDEELPVRAEALTLWCQGMLTGLKISNVPLIDREASELTEAINDFVEIAKMNYEEVVANEEDEEAYAELVEYVRMAVILVYQDLREGDAPMNAAGSADLLH